MEGICKICGCTEDNACYHQAFGPCWWLNKDKDLCSHCVELKNDPGLKQLNARKRAKNLILLKQPGHGRKEAYTP
jgi:hypothetical protein